MGRLSRILLPLVAVILAGRLGGEFAFQPSGVSFFWPSNAILFAALILMDPPDRKRCLSLAYPAYVATNLWNGFGIADSLFFAAVDSLEVALAVQVAFRLSPLAVGLGNLQQISAIFAATTGASILAGVIGAGWIAYAGGEFALTALGWAVSDLVSYLVFAPAILTLPDWRGWWQRTPPIYKIEASASIVLLFALSIVAYGHVDAWIDEFHGAEFLPIPVLLWLALRGGSKAASVSVLIVSFIALLYAIDGTGPFSDLSQEANVASLQVFIASIAIATLLVGVLVQERHEAFSLLSRKDQQQKEERYRAMVDYATDAIVIFDADKGTFIEANPRAAQLFGIPVKDLLGSYRPTDLSPEFQPDGRRSEEAAPVYLRQALDGESPTFEWMHQTRDGRDIPCQISLALFPDPERRLVHGSITDISEIKEAERHRHDLETKLAQAQKLEAIGQLTGGIAHDFNNLLSVILGNLELLSEDIENKDQIGMIEAAINATHKGANLTKNMLSFARRAQLRPTSLNLSDIVHDMENWISRTIPASIKVEKRLQPDLWQISADLATTESAVLNLMINARDAMLDGGVITIRTANVTMDDAMIGGDGDDLEPGHYALLAISDTGTGIPAENIERVFDPFFTTKGLSAGSGLGLSMVHGFMKQSGGGVRVYSEVGVGTTLKLYFPAVHVQEPEKEIAAKAEVGNLKASARILIAEDQEAVADLLVRILSQEGYTVVPAYTGDEACQIFRSDSAFDLLITDNVMPGQLQGPALAKELRDISPTLPVIFMTGYARETTDLGNGLRESDIRLMKPVAKKDLLIAVRSALLTVDRA